MTSESRFSTAGKVYLWSVIAAGFAVVIGSIYEMCIEPIGNQWFILAALTLISGSATVKLPSTYASISVSETFTFTAVLLWGPSAGTVIVALDGLVGSFWLSKRHRELHRALFNMSAPALSAWCAAHLFFIVSRIAPLVQQPSPVTAILPALILFALAYFGLNSWLITFVITLERHLSPFAVWKNSFGWISLNYFGGASVAFLLVGYNRSINIGTFGAIIPLLAVLYFTFKLTTGRVEDANKHVEQLNRLYLSTIETLAMAIDAKDQVTHGHIRRVQSQATVLARQIGVHDERLLKAIEAAALLHDMGKLAVPEYILNKPGKLTAAEFEKMKLHATVGADILSAIDFPYPVVPIVRHHHENWNGTGYPSGLRGTDIPIGARILSVVDCFDALTSDRPYRPRLSDQEAFAILTERRGSMYDPLVVDTFMRLHATAPAEQLQSGLHLDPHTTVNQSASTTNENSARLDEISASADETLSVYELSRALAGRLTVAEAGEIIAKHLRRLVPSSLCVVYIHDQQAGEIVASHAFGDGSSLVRGLRIEIGQRLSGWVVANRQTICNSDATLDLGDIARSPSLRLRNCASTPLIWNDDVVGVLSLYSTEPNGFNDDHRRILEVVAPQIAHTLRRARQCDEPSYRDSLASLPQLDQVEQLIQPSSDGAGRHALLFIEVKDLHRIATSHGPVARDEVLRHVLRSTRESLRSTDIVFRNGSDGVVVFLSASNRETVAAIVSNITERTLRNAVKISDDIALQVEASIKVVESPRDGMDLRELRAAAKRHAEGADSAGTLPIVH